ncbi:CheY chemotaxis protein or a CheY-like REC (receiver) domain [Tindallia magadiensis]|uniref:Stage 0 sporulation protein A homolog n=1 Tax=Tindallia magadiensis TaxID=69895 RepID=A0A1I3DLT8_9FIRM|nr:response regulator [Tindallia magadiensis]SFH87697.1 CheY chemotaxis protein or a CheY-like REC (receiver) domain [Tindallia magadiensis]
MPLNKETPKEQQSQYRSLEELQTQISQENLLVLVVEDDPMSRIFMEKILRRLGVEADFAKDGLEALRMYMKNEYDLIFLDIQMPVMNGYETAELIRQQEQMTAIHIPIIAVTAYALEEDKEKCLKVGMDYYLSKPVSMESLLKVLSDFCLDKSEEMQ